MVLVSQSRPRTCRRKYANYGRRDAGRCDLSSGNESSGSVRHVSIEGLREDRLTWVCLTLACTGVLGVRD